MIDALNAETSEEGSVRVSIFVAPTAQEVTDIIFKNLEEYRSLRYYSEYVAQIGQAGSLIADSTSPFLDALDSTMETLANYSAVLLQGVTNGLSKIDYADDHNQLSNIIGICTTYAEGDVIQSGNYSHVMDEALVFAAAISRLYSLHGNNDYASANSLLSCLNTLEVVSFRMSDQASSSQEGQARRRLQSISATNDLVTSVFSEIRNGLLTGETVTEQYTAFIFFAKKAWSFQLVDSQPDTLIFAGPTQDGTSSVNSVDFESVRKHIDLEESSLFSFDVLSFENMTNPGTCQHSSSVCSLISSPATMQYSFNVTTTEAVPNSNYELITTIRTAIDPTSLITSFDESNIEEFELRCPFMEANTSQLLEYVCSGGGAEGPSSTYTYLCDETSNGLYLTGSCPLYNRQVLLADAAAVEYLDYSLVEYDNTNTKFSYNVSVELTPITGNEVTYSFSGSSSTLVGLFTTIDGQTAVASVSPTMSPTSSDAGNLDTGGGLLGTTSLYSIIIPLILMCMFCIFLCLFCKRRREKDVLKAMDKYVVENADCLEDLFGVYVEFAQALREENRLEEAEELYTNAVDLLEGKHKVASGQPSVDDDDNDNVEGEGSKEDDERPSAPAVDIRLMEKASAYYALADVLTAQGKHLEALPMYRKAHSILKVKILGPDDEDDQVESDDDEDVISFETFTAGCKQPSSGQVLDGQLILQHSISDAKSDESKEDEVRSESHFFDMDFSHDLSVSLDEKKPDDKKKVSREKSSLFWPLTQAGQASAILSEESSSDDKDSIMASDLGEASEEYRKFVNNNDDNADDLGDEYDEYGDEDSDDDDDDFMHVNLVHGLDSKGKDSKDDDVSASTKASGAVKFEGGHEDGISRTFSSML